MNAEARVLISQHWVEAVEMLKDSGLTASYKAFCLSIGMQPQSFNDIKTGRRYVTIEMVHDTCNTYSINPNFILFGHRPVILPENVELDVEENVEVNRVVKINHVYPPLQTQVHTEILVATQDTSDNPTFSLINYKAAANYLTGYQSQEFYQKLAPVSLPRQLVGNPKQGIVLQIEGDSMAPKFQHGDYVAAVLLDRSEWPSIRDLDCYVVVSATHGVQFKRIKNRIPKYGFIRCRSDNRRHQSYNIEEENLLQLFRFVLHISPDASNPDDTLYNKVESIEERVEDQRDMYEQLMAQMQQMQKQLQQPTTH